MQFRLDVGELSLSLVGGLCGLARRFNYVLATTDGAIIQPNREAIIRAITQAPNMQFVRDPEGFSTEAIRLDGSDS